MDSPDPMVAQMAMVKLRKVAKIKLRCHGSGKGTAKYEG